MGPRRFALAVFLLSAAVSGPAEQFTGTVVAVIDGDTLSVTRGDAAELVSLYGVDCPERGQPFGAEAKQFTEDLVLRKQVTVNIVSPDAPAPSTPAGARTAQSQTTARGRPGPTGKLLEVTSESRERGRLPAQVVLPDSTLLNLRLVEAGLAWWDPGTAPTGYTLKKLNAEAMAAGRGLWVDPTPLAPWDFRKQKAKAEKTDDRRSEGANEVAGSGEGVFISKTGAQYHQHGCRFLDKTQKAISRTVAETRGYSPCPICFPEARAGTKTRELVLKGRSEDYAPRPWIERQAQEPAARRAAAPAVEIPSTMELMARHKPRLYRDANNNVLGITADNIGALPYADLLGVQDGDIVHMVNGVAIDSIETAFGLVDRFQNEKNFDVVVLRNGAPHTLHFSVP